MIDRKLTKDQPGFICLVTLVETMWVIKSSFKASREQSITVLEQLLAADTLLPQNEREVFRR